MGNAVSVQEASDVKAEVFKVAGLPVIANLRAQLSTECEKPIDCSDIGDDAETLATELKRLREWIRELRAGVAEAVQQHTKERQLPKEDVTKTLEDGTKIELRTDGYKRQTDPDGTVIECWIDGRKLQTSADGQCTMECLPDGTKVSIDKKIGVTVRYFPDGRKVQENQDGTVIEQFPDGRIVHDKGEVVIEVRPDGTQTQKNKVTGAVLQKFADGTKIDTTADGHRIVQKPDGKRIQRNPNGTVIETEVDGTKIQTKLDGSRITVYTDGRRIQQGVDGSVEEIFPDGRRVVSRISTRSCVQCWKCKTIVSVNQAQFITLCPMCRNVLMAHKTEEIGTTKKVSEANRRTSCIDVENEVKLIFERFDKDRSGGIDRAEMGQLLLELQFPPESFDDMFVSEDKNNNGQLEFDEFCAYFNNLQNKIMQSAQEPVLEMTKELLEEQRNALEKERLLVEQRKKELEESIRAGNTDAETAAKETGATLKLIKEEFEVKTRQLEQTKAEQKARQRAILAKRVQERAMQKGDE